jgi:hypothetical protein
MIKLKIIEVISPKDLEVYWQIIAVDQNGSSWECSVLEYETKLTNFEIGTMFKYIQNDLLRNVVSILVPNCWHPRYYKWYKVT